MKKQLGKKKFRFKIYSKNQIFCFIWIAIWDKFLLKITQTIEQIKNLIFFPNATSNSKTIILPSNNNGLIFGNFGDANLRFQSFLGFRILLRKHTGGFTFLNILIQTADHIR